MISFQILVCVIFVLVISPVEPVPQNERWNYKVADRFRGPQGWSIVYPACGGKSQSPIMINKSNVVYDPSLLPLDFSDYSLTTGLQFKLENHGGHTAEVVVSGRDIFLKGGSLSGMYRLIHFHFHWGKNRRRGSEHRLNGKCFPLEIHFCHVLVDCTGTPVVPKTVAVVGFFFRMGPHNEKYEQVLRYFDGIRYPGNETHIPTFSLSNLLPASRRYDYYRYQGSLTTPPCLETVTWSVGIDRISLSRQQLKRFRSLFDLSGQRMVDNFRPLQDINDRAIYTTNKRYGNGTVKRTSHAP